MNRGIVKVFTAAVAAIVVVAGALTAAPAFAQPAGAVDSAPSVRSAAEPVGPVVPAPTLDTTSIHSLSTSLDPSSSQFSAQKAAPDASAAAAGTASLTGIVSYQNRGPIAGARVIAVAVDADENEISESPIVTTDANGAFTIPKLAAGTYHVQYEEKSNPQHPTYQWFGGSPLDAFGTGIDLADGATANASWTLVPMGTTTGVITCETCTSPPDRSQTTVYLAIADPAEGNGYYSFVYGGEPDADGSFAFDSVYPASSYALFIDFTGPGPFSGESYTSDFGVSAGQNSVKNGVIARRIDEAGGIQTPVNTDVNALYWDFLTRLPSESDVIFWGKRIQNGESGGIVASGFVNSDEYRLIRIDAAYRSILNREPEQAGRLGWLNGMRAGVLTTDDIETSFYSSQEYYQNNGGTDPLFMAAIYKALLHRDGTASDYAFWSNLIAIHGRAWVVNQFWDSRETISERVSLMYEKYLGRVPDAGGLTTWVNVALQIGDSGLRAGLSGSEEYFVRSQYRYQEIPA